MIDHLRIDDGSASSSATSSTSRPARHRQPRRPRRRVAADDPRRRSGHRTRSWRIADRRRGRRRSAGGGGAPHRADDDARRSPRSVTPVRLAAPRWRSCRSGCAPARCAIVGRRIHSRGCDRSRPPRSPMRSAAKRPHAIVLRRKREAQIPRQPRPGARHPPNREYFARAVNVELCEPALASRRRPCAGGAGRLPRRRQPHSHAARPYVGPATGRRLDAANQGDLQRRVLVGPRPSIRGALERRRSGHEPGRPRRGTRRLAWRTAAAERIRVVEQAWLATEGTSSTSPDSV